jgi:hypothetical protein
MRPRETLRSVDALVKKIVSVSTPDLILSHFFHNMNALEDEQSVKQRLGMQYNKIRRKILLCRREIQMKCFPGKYHSPYEGVLFF